MTANAARAGKITIGADLEVNRLGYGAMRLTGEGVWGPHPDHENAIAVLKKVIELGVDFIDTANSYGPETNESLIHEALYPYPEGLVIATKGGLTRSGPNKWERNGDPVHLREQCELSLQRLGLETIDLYQLHAPDPDIPYAESVGALAELQREGLIRHVGISNVDSVQLEVALDIVDVVSVQNRFSISDRGSLEVLLACERHGLAFLPWFPLVAGSLEEDEVIDRIAARHDATRYQVAIAWLLQRSPVMLPIPGTSSISHLEENVAAGAIRLSEEEMLELEAVA
ncbi:MAG: aldo/keto reductase [Acidobacteria bacterium]|nr:aldo/keto reductase [Acidobacteriota bacterium]